MESCFIKKVIRKFSRRKKISSPHTRRHVSAYGIRGHKEFLNLETTIGYTRKNKDYMTILIYNKF